MENLKLNFSSSFLVKITLLAWIASIGLDFFLHAGLFAPFYRQASPFLLVPERAFALIPIGYTAFFLLAILLVWLMKGLRIYGGTQGFIFGLKIGGLTWGALILGLYSIATAPPLLLVGWFLGQTIELGVAGAVIGYGFKQFNLRRLFVIVISVFILLLILGLALQNLGQG
jgi:hypothetical protein